MQAHFTTYTDKLLEFFFRNRKTMRLTFLVFHYRQNGVGSSCLSRFISHIFTSLLIYFQCEKPQYGYEYNGEKINWKQLWSCPFYWDCKCTQRLAIMYHFATSLVNYYYYVVVFSFITIECTFSTRIMFWNQTVSFFLFTKWHNIVRWWLFN